MPPKRQRKPKIDATYNLIISQPKQKRTTKRRPRKPRAPKQQAMPTYETGYHNLLSLSEEQNRQVRAKQLDTAFSGLERLKGLYSGLPTSAELALRQRETIYGTDVQNRQQLVDQALKREQDTAKRLQEQKDRFKKIFTGMTKGGVDLFSKGTDIEQVIEQLDQTEMTKIEKANTLTEALLAGEDRKLSRLERNLVIKMSNEGKIPKPLLDRWNKKIYGDIEERERKEQQRLQGLTEEQLRAEGWIDASSLGPLRALVPNSNPVVNKALQQRQIIHTPAQQQFIEVSPLSTPRSETSSASSIYLPQSMFTRVEQMERNRANRQPSVAEFEAGLVPITPEPSPRPPPVPPLTHSMFQRVEKFRTASIAGEPLFNNGSMEDTLPTDRTIQTQQQINDTIASPNRFLQYRESQRQKQEKRTQELLSL